MTSLFWVLCSPPQNTMPVTLRDKSIGIEIFRYSQLATLSPVHIAPASQNKKKKHSWGYNHKYVTEYCLKKKTTTTYLVSVSQQRRSATGQKASLNHLSELSDRPLWPCAERKTELKQELSSHYLTWKCEVSNCDSTQQNLPQQTQGFMEFLVSHEGLNWKSGEKRTVFFRTVKMT